MTDEKTGLEEGDFCPNCDHGKVEYKNVIGCSCHINPPCDGCVNAPLVCNHCFYEHADAET